jgi:hypothetical protein
MRVTVNAAMRARDVSRIRPEDEEPPQRKRASHPARSRRAERRRIAKRSAGVQPGSGGSEPVRS